MRAAVETRLAASRTDRNIRALLAGDGPEMRNPTAKYWPAGAAPMPVELKMYPLFVPLESRLSMRQSPF